MSQNLITNNKVGLVIVILLFIGLLVTGIVLLRKQSPDKIIQEKKTQIEQRFDKINKILEKQDSLNVQLDSTEQDIIKTLQEYKEFIETNHYGKDSAYIYINNVHIDSLLARLPRFYEEQ